MKWYAIAITIVCLWLAFDKFVLTNYDKTNYDKLEIRADSLGKVVDRNLFVIDSTNSISEYWMLKADSNRKLLLDNINYSYNLKTKLNAINYNVSNLDSSKVFSELSNWLNRATSESLVNGGKEK